MRNGDVNCAFKRTVRFPVNLITVLVYSPLRSKSVIIEEREVERSFIINDIGSR